MFYFICQNFWLDVRAHLDPSPLTLNENTSIHRCYKYVIFVSLFEASLLLLFLHTDSLFRTMGMRHVVVVNGELQVVGIITRSEMNEHHLANFWKEHVLLYHIRII